MAGMGPGRDGDGPHHRQRGAPRGGPSNRRGSRGRGPHKGPSGAPKQLKLRQRERLEIAELKQRILLEMPQPGQQWVPPSLAALQQQEQQQEQQQQEQQEDPGKSAEATSSSSSRKRNGILTDKVFTDLPLCSLTLRGLASCGFSRLTQIQAAAIPHALAGRDIKAQAKTGSGKTLAFVVPVRLPSAAAAAAAAAATAAAATAAAAAAATAAAATAAAAAAAAAASAAAAADGSAADFPLCGCCCFCCCRYWSCVAAAALAAAVNIAAAALAAAAVAAAAAAAAVHIAAAAVGAAAVAAAAADCSCELLSFGLSRRYHEVSIGCLIGGKDVQAEAERVGELNIIVATPGRLLQHIDESPMWDASKLLLLAIDEADRLVDLGFQETVRLIVSSLPAGRQTLLFSATLRSAVQRLGQLLCSSKPESLGVDTTSQQQQQHSGGPLKQSYLVVNPKHKTSALFSILRAQCKKKIIAKFIHDTFKALKPGEPPSPFASAAAAAAAAAAADGVVVLLQRQHRARGASVLPCLLACKCPPSYFLCNVLLLLLLLLLLLMLLLLRLPPLLLLLSLLLCLHGRQKQQKRLDTFQDFVSRSSPCCLISTDLAARGIDFVQQKGGGAPLHQEGGPPEPKEDEGLTAVDLVVQFDCPDSAETHIHEEGTSCAASAAFGDGIHQRATVKRAPLLLCCLLVLCLSLSPSVCSPVSASHSSRLPAAAAAAAFDVVAATAAAAPRLDINLQRMTMNPKRAIRIEAKLQALLASECVVLLLLLLLLVGGRAAAADVAPAAEGPAAAAADGSSCCCCCCCCDRSPSLKALAQQAVSSYLRCLSVMPNKKVFNLNAIDLQQLALCYGLSIAPSIEHLAAADQQQQQQQQEGSGEESNPALYGGAVACSEGKKKNMSKLARFKVGLYPPRALAATAAATLAAATAAAATAAAVTAVATAAATAALYSLKQRFPRLSSPLSGFEQIRAKKLLKQQLRAQQQQQQQEEEEEEEKTEAQAKPSSSTRTSSAATNTTSSSSSSSRGGVGQGEDGEEDDEGGTEFLKLKRADVEPPEESSKFRADGTAKVKGLAAASANTHVIFDDDDEEDDMQTELNKPTSSSSSSSSSNKVASELRAAFLQQMRRKVESVQQDDKARDQQRIRERHLKKRRNERRARQGEAAASGATLLSSEDGDSAEESEASSAGEADASKVLRDEERGPPPPKKKRKEGLSVEALERLALQAAAAH
ncbi:hypothetical protein Emed_006550 [Eimeria media]